jgi:hypothetical protein
MEVAGVDAAVVVQVYVEGTKAAVQAASAGTGANGANGVALASGDSSGSDGEERPAPAKRGRKKKKAEEPPPTFDHVVVAIAVAEEFPDGRLKCALQPGAWAWWTGGRRLRRQQAGLSTRPACLLTLFQRRTCSWPCLGQLAALATPSPWLTAPLPACLRLLCSTPLIMHAGLVPHQHAKWQPPPDKWSAVPDAVGLSPSGEPAAHMGGGPPHLAAPPRRCRRLCRRLRSAVTHPPCWPACMPFPASLPCLCSPSPFQPAVLPVALQGRRRRCPSSATRCAPRTAPPCLWSPPSTPSPCACPSRTACSAE